MCIEGNNSNWSAASIAVRSSHLLAVVKNNADTMAVQ